MQPRRPHPFFSRLGCGAALLLALSLLLAVRLGGGSIFNPGPLSAAESGENLGGVPSHAALNHRCDACHLPWQGISAARCEQCHQIVAEQRTTGKGLHGLLPGTGRCATCHTEHHGAGATLTRISTGSFPHQRLTGFSLAHHTVDFDGAPLDCSGCHQGDTYTAAGVDCLECHTGAQADFIAGHRATFGDDCAGCHDGRDTMADFSHATVFPLDGAHADLRCEACHREQIFAGTPQQCAACHQEPALHAGLFGTECARCHTALAWQPARLSQHTFPLDHGDEGRQECQTCHEEQYTVYTCYSCHEHDPAGIREEHVEEGILQFEDCVACHPTGREDEGET